HRVVPESKDRVTGRGVQRVKTHAVGRGEIDDAVVHGGRRDHPSLLVVVIPFLFTGFCVYGVEMTVAAAEEDHTIRYRGGTGDSDLIVNVGIVAGLEFPDDRPIR